MLKILRIFKFFLSEVEAASPTIHNAGYRTPPEHYLEEGKIDLPL